MDEYLKKIEVEFDANFVLKQLSTDDSQNKPEACIMSDFHRADALMRSGQFVATLPLLQSALHRSEQKPAGVS